MCGQPQHDGIVSARGFLPKPYDAGGMLHEVRNVLDGREGSTSARSFV